MACSVAAVVFAQAPPAFRTGVELFTIEVQVVADRGKPLPVLGTERFDVRINGKNRRVVFGELVRYDDGSTVVVAPTRKSDREWFAAGGELFRPYPQQASALYLLGVELTDADRQHRESVKVKVREKGVNVRRWAWCVVADGCVPPSHSAPSTIP